MMRVKSFHITLYENLCKSKAGKFVFVFFLFSQNIIAQDIHFSQFSFSPMNLNPAYTGLFNGDYRFNANYRNQWFNVPVNYNTISVAADMSIYQLKNQDRIGGGILFYYDRAGDSRFTSIQAMASFSYLFNIGKSNNHTLGLGFNVGVGNRSVQYQYLYFDNQYNGDKYDGAIQPDENFPNSTFTYPDVGAGITYRFTKSERQSLTIGGGFHHLNSPQQSFFDDKSVKLNIRYLAHTSLRWKVHKKLDIVPEVIFQSQDTKYELAFGMHTKAFVFRQSKAIVCLNTGVYYRNNDAVFFLFGMDYDNLQVNLSYDINVSKFKPATNTYGAIEASVIYILKKVKKVSSGGSDCKVF